MKDLFKNRNPKIQETHGGQLQLYWRRMILGLAFIAGRNKDTASKHQKEIDNLLERTIQQEKALQDAYQKTNQLQNMQQQMYQTISTNQQQQVQAAIPDIRGAIQDIQEKY